MTETDLMNLKAALQTKRAELLIQLRGRAAQLTIESAPPDPLDRVLCMRDRDEAAGMLDRLSATLVQVERSLKAIDEEGYGECIRCDRPIPLRRLQIIPWTPYCVPCQERFEAALAQGWEPDFDEAQAA